LHSVEFSFRPVLGIVISTDSSEVILERKSNFDTVKLICASESTQFSIVLCAMCWSSCRQLKYYFTI